MTYLVQIDMIPKFRRIILLPSSRLIIQTLFLKVNQDNSTSQVIHYKPDGISSIPGRDTRYIQTAVDPLIVLPWLRMTVFLGVRRSETEANHSPPSSARFFNTLSLSRGLGQVQLHLFSNSCLVIIKLQKLTWISPNLLSNHIFISGTWSYLPSPPTMTPTPPGGCRAPFWRKASPRLDK
jgi:hypothetical protein